MNLLVTGCCGFIGSNFVKLLLAERPGWRIANLDALTYAGNRANLEDEEKNSPDYFFCHGDIRRPEDVERAIGMLPGPVDAIVNFAAESHVDNSIRNPGLFVETNVGGTAVLLQAARAKKCRFLQVSTDEVYGSLGPTGLFTEETPLAPNSPYSASKASADLMVMAWRRTYGLDALVTRCSNNYGPYQFPEKLIPLALTRLMTGGKIPIYGRGENVRDWLYVEDHCRGILLALEKGKAGEVYNIGGFNEWRNVDIARELLRLTDNGEDRLEYVADRLGHDRRYAIDSSKIARELGWRPLRTFETGLPETVRWYEEHRAWWEALLDRRAP